MSALPSGTVTFLFTDIQGSTRLWETYPEEMRCALGRHDALLRSVLEQQNGVVFKTVGDAFCAAFSAPAQAIAAALCVQQALQSEVWPQQIGLLPVRMALHTGQAEERDHDYFGPSLNRVARLLSIGHGGQILLSQATERLVTAALPSDCLLRDMGRCTLKDLQDPEQVFQLLHPSLPSEFPVLRSLDNLRTNLPRQASSFIGRQTEISTVKDLMVSAALLTLTGSGGCGKTRLALQVGAEVIDAYQDGVWLIELAELSTADRVLQQIASGLRLRDEPGRTLLETLTSYLKDRQLLLLLDNCEHLVEACASLVSSLLQACTHLRFLVTSRERLAVPGEVVWQVPPLLPPDPTRLPHDASSLPAFLMEYDACRLFVERARNHRPDFTLTQQNSPTVAELCHRLDGIPLALELAAVQIRVMTAEQIARRLEDRFRLLRSGSRTAPSRQQTLEGALAWSYDLLTAAERRLLTRLSVFAGGWTLEAAEQVCSDDSLAQFIVLETLSQLVDKSLILYEITCEGEGRYRLLETVREFALQHLTEEDRRELSQRHAVWFLALAERLKPDLHSAAQIGALDCLDREHNNFRAALLWGLDNAPQMAVRLAGTLYWFWHLHGYLQDGRDWLEKTLARSEADGTTSARALAQQGLDQIRFYLQLYISPNTESLGVEMWRELGNFPQLALTLMYRGFAFHRRENYAAALSCLEESVELASVHGDAWLRGMTLWGLGTIHWYIGEAVTASSYLEESLVCLRSTGDAWAMSAPLMYLAEIYLSQGNRMKARPCIEEALTYIRPVGDKWRYSAVLDTLGELHLSEGNLVQALDCFQQSLTICQESLGTRRMAYILRNIGHVARLQGEFERARVCYRESLVFYGQHNDRRHIANTIVALACLLVAEGKMEDAAYCFGLVAALRMQSDTPPLPMERPEQEQALSQTRAFLGESRLEELFQQVQDSSCEVILAAALML